MTNCKTLNEVRNNIDRIDKDIVKLISERSCYVKQAANFKKDSNDVKAPDRVEMVINKIRNLSSEYDVNPDIVEGVYRKMIGLFIEMELLEHKNLKVDN